MQMNAYLCGIIKKYYPESSEAYHILTVHSRSVADKALEIARRHPELNLDLTFIEEAAMLHDIGIFKCDADGIDCHGEAPYICHGYLGADLIRDRTFPENDRRTELAGSASGYASGFVGRTDYLLCRQVFQ